MKGVRQKKTKGRSSSQTTSYKRSNKVFNATHGTELDEHCKQAAKLQYGLTKMKVLKLAFQYGK
jgi:hypothetical protein